MTIDQDLLNNLFTEAALVEQFDIQCDGRLCDTVLSSSGPSAKNDESDYNEVEYSPVLDGGRKLG